MTRSTLIQKLDYVLPQIKLLLVREPAMSDPVRLITPLDAVEYLEPLRQESEEHFITLHVDARHQVIGVHQVSHGTLVSSLVHPREVYKAALLANSYGILLAHNHPTGKTTPSDDDLDTTRQLVKAGGILGISVLDHIIVGDDFYSIRENYPDLFKP